MKTYTVQCERDESGTWVATVPELPGVVTQSRRLANIPDLVRDAIELWLDDTSVQIDLELVVVGAETARIAWDESRRLRADADEKAAESAKLARFAVADLSRLGLSMRDTAEVLGVSFQRVNQLKDDTKPKPATPRRTALSKSKNAKSGGKQVGVKKGVKR
jgi:predicted RNase H-like HicB family nuclease